MVHWPGAGVSATPYTSKCIFRRGPFKRPCISPSRSAAGQGTTEYIIILIVVAIVVIVAIRYYGQSVSNQFKTVGVEVEHLREKPSSTNRDTGKDDHLPEDQLDSGSLDGEDFSEPDSKLQEPNSLSSLAEPGVGESGQSANIRLRLQWWDILGTFFIIVCLGLLAVGVIYRRKIVRILRSMRQKRERSGSGEGGQAMVEFLFCSITFLFVLLGILQLAMALNAYFLVRYAAYNAARAAVVHGAELNRMHEAARVSLLAVFPRHGRADHRRGFAENYAAAKASDSNPALTYFGEPITEVRVLNKDALNAAQTFDDPSLAVNAIITVQVTHQYELVIPLVNRIIFWVYTRFRSGEFYDGQSLEYLSSQTDKLRRSGAFKDIEYRIPLVAHHSMRMHSDFED